MTPAETSAATRAWEPWRLPALDDVGCDGFNHLARYVVPRHVLDAPRFSHAFSVPPASQTQEVRVRALWDDLVRQDLGYARPLYGAGRTERIRHPGLLLRSGGSGTCVDVATLFAAALMRADIATWLVMLTDEERAHVGIAVHTGAPLSAFGDEHYVPHYARRRDTGVHEVRDVLRAELLADPHLRLIDVTAALQESSDRSVGQAVRLLADAIRGESETYRYVHLLDVEVRQKHGDEPYDDVPRDQGILSLDLDGLDAGWVSFDSRGDNMQKVLAAAGGTVIIRGESGLGKSQLALAAAQKIDQGFGWFLAGDSTLAFQTSLALAEARERGLNTAAIVDDVATRRTDLSRAAVTRLADTREPWVVIVDNADEDAVLVRDILASLPTPGPGQLVVVTTTLPRRDVQQAIDTLDDDRVLDLEPLEPHETRRVAGAQEISDDLLDLAGGNPLLVAALARLVAGSDVPLSVPAATGREPSEIAAGVVVAAAVETRVADELTLARLALMPPDSIPGWLVEDEERMRLLESSILTPRVGGDLGMHRLFGRAVRDRVPQVLPGAAARLLRDRAVVQHLYQRGTNVDVLDRAMSGMDDGRALAGLGIVQEQHHPGAAYGTFARAHAALGDDPENAEDRLALAETLHAEVRAVHQDTSADRETKRGALALARRAAELFGSGNEPITTWQAAGVAKARALEGLLMRGLATSAEELIEAMAILQESHESRLAILGPEDPLVDRAYFNPAGGYIRLAQADRANAREHLDAAYRVYVETRAFRQRFYPAPSGMTAASVNGLALVEYYRVLLVDLAKGGDAATSAGRLARAGQLAAEAMATREAAQSSPDAIGQSARILTKVGLLRWALAGKAPKDLVGDEKGEARTDLREAGLEG